MKRYSDDDVLKLPWLYTKVHQTGPLYTTQSVGYFG